MSVICRKDTSGAGLLGGSTAGKHASTFSCFRRLNLFANRAGDVQNPCASGRYANKRQVLHCITSARQRTEMRLAQLQGGSAAVDRLREGQLRVCLSGIKTLENSISTNAIRWQDFGGFTGHAQDNRTLNWAPESAGFGEYHGWINYAIRGEDEHQEIVFESARADQPVTQSAQSRRANSFTARLSRFFKGTDGWDELGSGIGQTLPGIGQHLATSVILGVLAPFVYLGVVGMKEEMDECAASLKEIIEKQQDSRFRVAELLGLSCKMAGVPESGQVQMLLKVLAKRDDLSQEAFENCVYELVKQIQVAIDKQAAQVAYEATPYGLAAMSGMFGGMLAGTTAATMEVADAATSGSVAALGTLADVFGVVTAGLFIPSQLAMIVYGGKKAKEGQLVCHSLKKQRDALIYSKSQQRNGAAVFDAALRNNRRLRQYHHQGKVVYGRGIQISEAGMIVGGVMSLLGLGIAGIATLIPAALSTIGFAAYRIFQEHRLRKFTGNTDAGMLDDPASADFAKPKAIERLEKKYLQVTQDLAHAKIQSVLLRGLSRRRWCERMWRWLPTVLAQGRWSFFRRTSLATDILQTVSQSFATDVDYNRIPRMRAEHRAAELVRLAQRIFKWETKKLSNPKLIVTDIVADFATSGLLDILKNQMVRIELVDSEISERQLSNTNAARQRVIKLSGAELLQRVLRDPVSKASMTGAPITGTNHAEENTVPQFERLAYRDALLLAALRVKVTDDKDKLKRRRQAIFDRLALQTSTYT